MDPEWVENLNSVLDDNKVLTLPNGERLAIPETLRIFFEVDSVREATPATITRCGLVWFDQLVTPSMISSRFLSSLISIPLEDFSSEDVEFSKAVFVSSAEVPPVQKLVAEILKPFFTKSGIFEMTIQASIKLKHIMSVSIMQMLDTFFPLMLSSIKAILRYNATHIDFPMDSDHLELYAIRSFYLNLAWSCGASLDHAGRGRIGNLLMLHGGSHLGTGNDPFDYSIDISTGNLTHWSYLIPQAEIDASNISTAEIVIPTIDTLKNEMILYSLLAEHKLVILVGPPGSGKTMTILASIRRLPDIELLTLNFSSETTAFMIEKALILNCACNQTAKGMTLSPKIPGSWLVIFCDEINLPTPDVYGTQLVLVFIRQLVEQQGFWRSSDRQWINIERVQIIGACNPPKDVGRYHIPNRLLRYCSVVFVDTPGTESLKIIFGSFCRAALKEFSHLRGFSEPLNSSMVEFYSKIRSSFTTDKQAHYLYSAREMIRWIRGIYEIVHNLNFVHLADLVRVWAHEALRLFQDRLVTESERTFTYNLLKEVANNHFPNLDINSCCSQPILFSNLTTANYISVNISDIFERIKAKMILFQQEGMGTPLILHDQALKDILRIDRVFRQPQGHMLLIGLSGQGKATLIRFTAWLNGISIIQPSMHKGYNIAEFDEDLRIILRSSGLKGDKVCFLMEENSIVESSFLERMNTLLANSEIPGLFEGEEFLSLMSGCKETSAREGKLLDTKEELYKWFTSRIRKNLHVMFTMNPMDTNKLSERAGASPALFNRCVIGKKLTANALL